MADAKAKAQEAKDKAQAALNKASDTKSKLDRSNNDLRDLIKQIRAFLMREYLLRIYLVPSCKYSGSIIQNPNGCTVVPTILLILKDCSKCCHTE